MAKTISLRLTLTGTAVDEFVEDNSHDTELLYQLLKDMFEGALQEATFGICSAELADVAISG